MASDNIFVAKKFCPVCKKETRVVKARSRAIAGRTDEDYCVHYQDFNPYLYKMLVCENCGFVADEKTFNAVLPTERRVKIWEILSHKGILFGFKEVHTLDDAIDEYHTFLNYIDILKPPLHQQAAHNLNLGWLYRFAEDKINEHFYLKRAAELYEESMAREKYPIKGVTEANTMYLIAAIYYRIREVDLCKPYLTRIMNDREIREHERNVCDMTRNLWTKLRELEREIALEKAKAAGSDTSTLQTSRKPKKAKKTQKKSSSWW